MTDWRTYKGQYPWPIVPVVDKISYNEGNRITTSSEPVWKLEDNLSHTPITTIHEPCSYWSKISIPSMAYNYITAFRSPTPASVDRINYYTGVVEASGVFSSKYASAFSFRNAVYSNKFYTVCYNSTAPYSLDLIEYDITLQVVVRELVIQSGQGVVYTTALVNNLLYVSLFSSLLNKSMLITVNLDLFAVISSMTISDSYGSAYNLVITGTYAFLFGYNKITQVRLSDMTEVSTVGISEAYNVAVNDAKTECVVACNSYTLYKFSLTSVPPVLLSTKVVSFLTSPYNSSAVDRRSNDVYFGDKFDFIVHKINIDAFDVVTDYVYGDATTSAPVAFYVIENKLWLCYNYIWIDIYRKIVRIDLTTMTYDLIIDVPTGNALTDIIFS